MTTIEMIYQLNAWNVDYRFETGDDMYHISHINRQLYPRIWIDNAVDNRPVMIAETDENILQRCSPLAEKDWYERFENEDFDKLIAEFFEYISAKRSSPPPSVP